MAGHEQAPDWAKARTRATKPGPERPEKHPWATTPVGGTFDIPAGPGQPKKVSMATLCKMRRRAGKGDFICHQYPDGLIQVYRRG